MSERPGQDTRPRLQPARGQKADDKGCREDIDIPSPGSQCRKRAAGAETGNPPAQAEHDRAKDQPPVDRPRLGQLETPFHDRGGTTQDQTVTRDGHSQSSGHDKGKARVPGPGDIEEIQNLAEEAAQVVRERLA